MGKEIQERSNFFDDNKSYVQEISNTLFPPHCLVPMPDWCS